MRIVRFIDERGTVCLGTGMEHGQVELISGNITGAMKLTGVRVNIKKVLPPLEPTAIFCIGLNYKAHAHETGMDIPPYPVVFMKNPASVTGTASDIYLPESCRDPLQVDYEVELAVIIGKAAKNVKAADALDYVAGYTVANDVSARRWQKKGGGGQWVRGKSFDTFCPMGPELVTADEIPDPNSLDIICRLNGEIMQESNTCDMIFSVKKLIEFLSEDTTLLPGTVILTGTPSGVGFARTPPVFLKPGDRLALTIEKIGTLVNSVV